MRVGVGSQNPVKRGAVERAVAAAGLDASVEPVDVDSGVSDQPTGESETVAGAENRAERTFDADGSFALGVGLEGGVADAAGGDGLYLVMWAAATDGDRLGRGAGPRMLLPGRIATRVRAGEELGPVLGDVVCEADVGERQGAAGVLTGGIVDRESALVHAVAGALGPFVTGQYR